MNSDGSLAEYFSIGFGKSVDQNLEIIHRLAELRALGRPILLGTSRKFMINRPPDQRLEATAATVAIGIANGNDMVRVHDVQQMVLVYDTEPLNIDQPRFLNLVCQVYSSPFRIQILHGVFSKRRL
ncbi:dihydropteroate synthase [Dehalococcoidales bacterium]|nr:dihydropteroate synthase [Dehalococcoidales bacterium]MCL0053218.1 dihydropteroate synthase [Dehalococcoidales bacterium]